MPPKIQSSSKSPSNFLVPPGAPAAQQSHRTPEPQARARLLTPGARRTSSSSEGPVVKLFPPVEESGGESDFDSEERAARRSSSAEPSAHDRDSARASVSQVSVLSDSSAVRSERWSFESIELSERGSSASATALGPDDGVPDDPVYVEGGLNASPALSEEDERQATKLANFASHAREHLTLFIKPFISRSALRSGASAPRWRDSGSWDAARQQQFGLTLKEFLASYARRPHRLAVIHYNLTVTLRPEDLAEHPYLVTMRDAIASVPGFRPQAILLAAGRAPYIPRHILAGWLREGRVQPAEVEQAFGKQPLPWLLEIARGQGDDPLTRIARTLVEDRCNTAGGNFVAGVDAFCQKAQQWQDLTLAQTILVHLAEFDRSQFCLAWQPARPPAAREDAPPPPPPDDEVPPPPDDDAIPLPPDPVPSVWQAQDIKAKLMAKVAELLQPGRFEGTNMTRRQLEELLATLGRHGTTQGCLTLLQGLTDERVRLEAQQAQEDREKEQAEINAELDRPEAYREDLRAFQKAFAPVLHGADAAKPLVKSPRKSDLSDDTPRGSVSPGSANRAQSASRSESPNAPRLPSLVRDLLSPRGSRVRSDSAE